ncbi:MAG TPA: nuclear transport factor 2 family protein [Opitutaceae bacterium]|nr:nuclear transport factor 2 family protein [Opitutaceae bacterium]HND61884.1 nuclear transport factor 2 family protein [Opitutaceae bacterium]
MNVFRRGSALVLVLLFGLFAMGCATVAPTPEAKAREEAAVRSTLTRMNEVLAKRDKAGFMALFDDSDEIMIIGSDVGEVCKGRKGVEGFIKWIYSQKFTFAFDLKEVAVHQEGDFAWVYEDGNMLHVRTDGKVTKIPYRFALTMVKRGDQWRWQLFHGSIPRGE